MQKICVLGLGYIGLPTAAMFATHGFQVVGVDVNNRIVHRLNNADIHIQEPGLKTLVQAALKSGNLRVVDQPVRADIFIIAVPTPLSHPPPAEAGPGNRRPQADLGYVISATESIVPYLQAGNLVILESTVPPRTTIDGLLPILEQSGLKAIREFEPDKIRGDSPSRNGGPDASRPGSNLYVAHCPERVLPGRILEELVGNDRIIGGVCHTSARLAKALYTSFVEGEFHLTDATTAEMVKLMENTYRDVNIALANEFALVAEQVGMSRIEEAIDLANRHPRVNILKPGPGVGGHCIAVDPWFIIQAAPALTPLIQTGRQVNDGMPRHVVDLVKKALAVSTPSPARSRTGVIACLGLAYKADVDDARESPAVEVVKLLQAEGFVTRSYDPHVKTNVVSGQETSLETTLDQADVIVILTDHSQFRTLTPEMLAGFSGQIVIDTRGVLAAETWERRGLKIWGVGKFNYFPTELRSDF